MNQQVLNMEFASGLPDSPPLTTQHFCSTPSITTEILLESIESCTSVNFRVTATLGVLHDSAALNARVSYTHNAFIKICMTTWCFGVEKVG